MNKVENFFENNFLGQVIFVSAILVVCYVMFSLACIIGRVWLI